MPNNFYRLELSRILAWSGLLLSLGFSHAYSQGRLTLSTATEEAIQFNQQLRVAQFDARATQADLVSAGLTPNPTLTVQADILPSEGLGPSEKNYGVSVNFPFELGGKRDARVKSSQAAIAAANLQYRDLLRQTVGSVRLAYFDFLGSAERAAVAQESLTLLDSLVALSRVRVAGRDIAPVELTRSEVERERFALDVLRAQEEHRATLTTLFSIMGRARTGQVSSLLPDSSIMTSIQELSRSQLPSLDSLLAIAENERTDIQVLRAQEASARANLELQRSLATIDLNVSLDLLRSQNVTFYGSTVSVPLPFSNRNQGEIAKAEIRLDQSTVQTEAALAQLRADVTNAWFDASTKQRTLRTLQTSVLEKAAAVRTAIEYSYKRGGTSLVDYLDAARTYNELKQAYVDALQSYAKSLVTLNLTTGKDLYYAR